MFHQARLKLTGWYLLIIMMVSFSFSFVIYRASNFELNRFAQAQRSRFESRTILINENGVPFHPSPSPTIDAELLEDARNRIIRSLFLINLGILSASFVLGYYLSGLTLAPIQEMMDEQHRFVSDASHELKTPITAIKSTLEVSMRDKQLDLAEAKQTIKNSLEEVNGLQKLAEGLLQLSEHKNAIVKSSVLLSKVVEDAIKMTEPLAEDKKITLTKKLVNVVVLAQEDMLRRAIVTIIDNAIKYSGAKSKISVTSRIAGKNVELTIKDQGKGIDEADIEHVFDRFYRSEKSRNSDGYGLGLSIAKQIVEEHGGEIVIESKPGKGTTVSLIFPYSGRLQQAKLG